MQVDLDMPVAAQISGQQALFSAPCAADKARLVNSSCLFGSAREVVIAHNGREYRLRITAQKKLILTA